MIETAITTDNRLKRINDYISHMPSLSTTSTKVLEICNSPNTSANDLNRVISLDPVLAAQVLKLVNSAYYSLANKVTSLTKAIILMGLNTVKNLALSMVVMDGLGGEGPSQAFSVDDFWTHSICVGVTAKSLAALKGIPVTRREEYFVAGLLHDLGKIPINTRFPDDFYKALELSKVEHLPLHQVENRIFGIDHCLVGGMIADKWQLSGTINEVLCHHHDPNEANEEYSHMVAIVAVGNIYSNFIEIGSSGGSVPEESIINYLLEKAGVSWDKLSELHETIVSEIEKARFFLEITQKG